MLKARLSLLWVGVLTIFANLDLNVLKILLVNVHFCILHLDLLFSISLLLLSFKHQLLNVGIQVFLLFL